MEIPKTKKKNPLDKEYRILLKTVLHNTQNLDEFKEWKESVNEKIEDLSYITEKHEGALKRAFNAIRDLRSKKRYIIRFLVTAIILYLIQLGVISSNVLLFIP